MGLYLLIRIYSGVHEKEKLIIESWKQLQVIEDKHKNTYIKRNLIIYAISLVLTIVSVWVGSCFGEVGLWIGIVVAIVVWIISPYETEVKVQSRNKE